MLTTLLEIEESMMLAYKLTHFGYEKEGLEGVLNSAQISQVLSIVNPERV